VRCGAITTDPKETIMLRTRFTLAAAAAIATAATVLPAGASAAGSPADRAAGKARTVCAPGTYVKERPDVIPVDI